MIFYVNGNGCNITAHATISPRGDGNNNIALVVICSEGNNGDVILEGRAVVYHKAIHRIDILHGWRWTSPSTYHAVYDAQINPAYIEAR